MADPFDHDGLTRTPTDRAQHSFREDLRAVILEDGRAEFLKRFTRQSQRKSAARGRGKG